MARPGPPADVTKAAGLLQPTINCNSDTTSSTMGQATARRAITLWANRWTAGRHELATLRPRPRTSARIKHEPSLALQPKAQTHKHSWPRPAANIYRGPTTPHPPRRLPSPITLRTLRAGPHSHASVVHMLRVANMAASQAGAQRRGRPPMHPKATPPCRPDLPSLLRRSHALPSWCLRCGWPASRPLVGAI